MKIHLTGAAFAALTGATPSATPVLIQAVAYDTRKISNPDGLAFFALSGNHRDGHAYVDDAYLKGVRIFVVNTDFETAKHEHAVFYKVPDPLKALQQLARHHRDQFTYPVIAITGSVGKTIVKEWIYHLISGSLRVVRSPKSYNSQLGVALSLLELESHHQVALIEAGISQPAEMEILAEMIHPTFGVFTAIGSAHAQNFETPADQLTEKIRLFSDTERTWYNADIPLSEPQVSAIHGRKVSLSQTADLIAHSPFQDAPSKQNLALALAVALDLGLEAETLKNKIKHLPRLALRMETFDGMHGNLIVNDTYNLDLDALTQSLEYQLSLAGNRKRVAIISLDGVSEAKAIEIRIKLQAFKLDQIIFVEHEHLPTFHDIRNSVVLIKGTRMAQLQRIASLFQLRKHKTQVEINLSAVRDNLHYFRSLVDRHTRLLVMVKASSYGSGAEKIAEFLQKSGVEYLGVAYADEGVELREHGITLPILVMNAEEDGFDSIIEHRLEPAIYSYEMMDNFVKALITHSQENYPVHLKFDTGMRRLGFEPDEVEKVLDLFQAQPEVTVKGVYSHLADSDNPTDGSFTVHQITLFEQITEVLEKRLTYPFIKHLLNTEGVQRFPQAQYDMVRLGIGLYGYSSNPAVQAQLKPAIAWKSVISQIKHIAPGESVGYNRSYIADNPRTIAIVPVGYADGFKRSLSSGKGSMFVNGQACPVLGRVCMDMTMIDITDLDVKVGDTVEIIGENQPIRALAAQMETIVYEVLTSISRRVQRVYLEE
jgi:alanine racemase